MAAAVAWVVGREKKARRSEGKMKERRRERKGKRQRPREQGKEREGGKRGRIIRVYSLKILR